LTERRKKVRGEDYKVQRIFFQIGGYLCLSEDTRKEIGGYLCLSEDTRKEEINWWISVLV
jgi:hypothetical protein